MSDNFLSARKDLACLYGLFMNETHRLYVKSPQLSSFCETFEGLKKYLLTGAEVLIIGRKCEKRIRFEH